MNAFDDYINDAITTLNSGIEQLNANGGIVAVVVGAIAIFIAYKTLKYQKKTYHNTRFLVSPDDALSTIMQTLLFQLINVEKAFYVTKRVADTTRNKSFINQSYYCGLKIDLSPLDNSLFYSDKQMITNMLNIKYAINKLNQFIDNFFLNNHYSQISKEEFSKSISFFSEIINKAYTLWPDIMSIIIERVDKKASKEKIKNIVDAYISLLNASKMNPQLMIKAKEFSKEYKYSSLIEVALFDKEYISKVNSNKLLIDFVNEYKRIIEMNLIENKTNQ